MLSDYSSFPIWCFALEIQGVVKVSVPAFMVEFKKYNSDLWQRRKTIRGKGTTVRQRKQNFLVHSSYEMQLSCA